MKKLILAVAMASVALPGVAAAQDSQIHQDRRDDRQDQRDMRHDRREVRDNRRDMRRDVRQDRRAHQRIAYVAPYNGWNYRPVNVGFQLRPAFYGPRYMINDYGTYQLRAPARWQRWVRYGDDLLLVNARTGRVLQVVHYRNW